MYIYYLLGIFLSNGEIEWENFCIEKIQPMGLFQNKQTIIYSVNIYLTKTV